MYVVNDVVIRRFKSIESATIKLGPRNVLIGSNGAGKSLALQASLNL
jgi:predicted ATP-dependent endonuclease of OLD family